MQYGRPSRDACITLSHGHGPAILGMQTRLPIMAEHAGDANQTSNQHQRAGTSPYSPRRSNRDGVPTLPTLPQRIASASSWSRSPGIHCPPAARPYAGSSDRSFASSTATLTPYPDHGSPTGWSIATLDTLDTGPDAEDAPVIRKASLAQELLKGVHKKRLRGNRWMSRPREGAHDEWVHEEDRATEWLSLFYGQSCREHQERPMTIAFLLGY